MGLLSFHNGRKAVLGGLLFSLVMIFPILPGTGTAHAVEIEIQKISTVVDDDLLLSHIARIHAKDFLQTALGEISLGKAPKPGKIRQFEKKRLLRMIQASRLVDDSATITCPDQIYVKRKAQTLEKDMVQDEVLAFLENRFSPRKFEILSMNIRKGKSYPEGDLQLVPGSRCFIGSNGRFSVAMKVLVDDMNRGDIFVTGKLAEFDTLICAARYLAKDTMIHEQDICLEKKNLMLLRTRGIKDKDLVIGQTVKFPMNKGQVIEAKNIIPASLVDKGDVVTLVVSSKNLRIVTPGVCLEKGFLNEPLLVQNMKSGKKVRGILRKDRTVEVLH